MLRTDLRMTVSLLIFALSLPAFGLVDPNHFNDPSRKLDLSVADTQWDFFEGEDLAGQSDLELQFIARSRKITANKTQATLTWRVDKAEHIPSKTYSEKWLKEFPKFGYELQHSKEAKYGALEGFDMELISTISDRRVRQFIVARQNEMWVFTCSAEKKQFKEAWKSCEKILSTASLK